MSSATSPSNKSLRIPSEGYELDADLYLPSSSTNATTTNKPPIIILAHGLGALKSMKLQPFALAFTQLGLAALVFDYRGFGRSTGKIREWVDPWEHLKDWRNAIKYVRDGHVDAVDNKRMR